MKTNWFSNKRNSAIALAAIYVAAVWWLSSVWYNLYAGFHFFDDLLEWNYLDKCAHFFASFQFGFVTYQLFGDSENLNPTARKKWLCFIGFFLLLPIEILDGFSLNYGASPADLVANALGSVFCFFYVSNKVVSGFIPKFSFHSTAFSLLRPDMLGSTFFQQIIKDYNGQTYWLSLDLNKIFNAKILPDWLMVTVGYGAEGLLGGHDNVWQNKTGELVDYSSVTRTKRIFISMDINAGYFRDKGKFLSYAFAPFVLIKFPAPAIEINFDRGIIFHPIYF